MFSGIERAQDAVSVSEMWSERVQCLWDRERTEGCCFQKAVRGAGMCSKERVVLES